MIDLIGLVRRRGCHVERLLPGVGNCRPRATG